MTYTPKDKSLKAQYERFVVNIDIAQRLYACGFNHPTMFFWVANPQLDTLTLYRGDSEYLGPLEHRFWAPTAGELKEYFPDEVWITTKNNSLQRKRGLFYFTKYGSHHIVSLMVTSDETHQVYEFHREEDSTEANACGEMLCYITENEMIPRSL
jgi:hypothetical protein